VARTYRDPVTGDELTFAENVSWKLQGLIRNWYFIGAITVVTVVVSIIGRAWTFHLMDIWNFSASYMALFIESIVGIAMFSQTRRDAKVIREVRAHSVQLTMVLERLEHIISDESVVDTKTYELAEQNQELLVEIAEGIRCPICAPR
jgi:hypothetical protein